MMSTAVIIARFQTPYLHKGHHHLIKEVRKSHNKTVIVLGNSPVIGTRKNPFDYITREKMLKAAYPDVVVLPLQDHPDDRQWSENLDILLHNTFPYENFVLYGGRDSFIRSYFGKYQTKELPSNGHYNSTDIRKHYSDRVEQSQDFRKGVLYAVNHQYERVCPTVDVAVFRNDREEVLLGMKSLDRRWRLIGGFIDPGDYNYEQAARRELNEEAGAIEVSPMIYEISMKIDDWRYREGPDKVLTTLFSCDHLFGTPKAQDDIMDTGWFKTAILPEMLEQRKIAEEHRPLIDHLLKKYLRKADDTSAQPINTGVPGSF